VAIHSAFACEQNAVELKVIWQQYAIKAYLSQHMLVMNLCEQNTESVEGCVLRRLGPTKVHDGVVPHINKNLTRGPVVHWAMIVYSEMRLLY